ncbi:MAG: hypothetical protein R2838_00245 [Caldilineaceae bacterium]
MAQLDSGRVRRVEACPTSFRRTPGGGHRAEDRRRHRPRHLVREGGGVQNEEGTINAHSRRRGSSKRSPCCWKSWASRIRHINTEWLLPAAAAAASVDAGTYMTDVIIYRHYATRASARAAT